MKRHLEDIEFHSSLTKHFSRHVTSFLDLPDEIFVEICRYMLPFDIVYSFYTPEQLEMYFHRLIIDYSKNIKIDGITNKEFCYLSKLFCHLKNPLQPESLILSNVQVSSVIKRYSKEINTNTIKSMFNNFKSLTLIDCSSNDFDRLTMHEINLTQLEYLHITIKNFDQNTDPNSEPSDIFIKKLLFQKQITSLQTVIIQSNDGVVLYRSLIINPYLQNIHIDLQTIDDLYILLNGLVPNVKIMLIQLRQTRLLKSRRPPCKSPYSQLTQFTLFDTGVRLVMDDIKCIFPYMPNLIQLTLSVRDTPDPTFCQGSIFESILNEYLPHVQKFDYTMTHRMSENTLMEDFLQWPMNNVYYDNEDVKWIHIYSLPWPSSKDDKRELPVVKSGSNLSVTSDVKRCEYVKHVLITKQEEFSALETRLRRACEIRTCLSIEIELPSRIYKLILSEETPASSINSIVQPSIRHLIVKRRLSDEREIAILARQFPGVKYMEFLFPDEKSLFNSCLKSVFSFDGQKEKPCHWPELVNFSTLMSFHHFELIYGNRNIHLWLIQNTDLKYAPCSFYANCNRGMLSIWF